MPKDHEHNGKKQKLVNVEVMYALFENDHGLELIGGITERGNKNCMPKLKNQVFCRPARLWYNLVKVLNKSLKTVFGSCLMSLLIRV